jgi:hypothetical protein
MAASIYSDERLKRDIVQVGALEDGLPVIDFNYRDGLGFPKAGSAASALRTWRASGRTRWARPSTASRPCIRRSPLTAWRTDR